MNRFSTVRFTFPYATLVESPAAYVLPVHTWMMITLVTSTPISLNGESNSITGDNSTSTGSRCQLDTSQDEPALQVVEVLADIDGRDPTDFEDMWGCTDDMLANLFSNPPAPEADTRVTFTFEGYRISVHQDGMAEFQAIEEAT